MTSQPPHVACEHIEIRRQYIPTEWSVECPLESSLQVEHFFSRMIDMKPIRDSKSSARTVLNSQLRHRGEMMQS